MAKKKAKKANDTQKPAEPKKLSGKGKQKDWSRYGKTGLYTAVKKGERVFISKKQYEKLPK